MLLFRNRYSIWDMVAIVIGAIQIERNYHGLGVVLIVVGLWMVAGAIINLSGSGVR